MTKRQKRLQRIRQNPKNVSFEDLELILEDCGVKRHRSSGSHHAFQYVLQGQTKTLIVPYRRPIKPVYVKQALEIIDKIREERGE